MAEPPVFAGAVHLTVAEAFPAVVVPMVGAPGTVAVVGLTVLESAENGLSPMALLASTWNRYWDPLVRPVTTRLVAPAGAVRRAPTWTPAGSVVTSSTFTEKASPGPTVGAVQRTVACPGPAVAVPITGAPGSTVSENCRNSMLRIVSVPSAPTLSTTVVVEPAEPTVPFPPVVVTV